jgi:hypothetical protein
MKLGSLGFKVLIKLSSKIFHKLPANYRCLQNIKTPLSVYFIKDNIHCEFKGELCTFIINFMLIFI